MNTPDRRADLAGQVLTLAQDLAALHQRAEVIEEHAAALHEGLEALGAQDQVIGALAARLDALEHDDPAAGDPATNAWDWSAMNRADAEQAWQVLTAWVRRELAANRGLIGAPIKAGTKTIPRIPACWYRHTDVKIELSWLCQEWIEIYRTPQGTPARRGDWHERYLPGVLRRIATSSAANCGRTHTEAILDVHPGVDDEQMLAQIRAADLAGRPDGPAD